VYTLIIEPVWHTCYISCHGKPHQKSFPLPLRQTPAFPCFLRDKTSESYNKGLFLSFDQKKIGLRSYVRVVISSKALLLSAFRHNYYTYLVFLHKEELRAKWLKSQLGKAGGNIDDLFIDRDKSPYL
jgi:hypothetical protein